MRSGSCISRKHKSELLTACVHRLSGNMYWTCDVHLLMMPLFPSVAYVNLSQCELVNHIHSLSALPALKRLDLNWCTGLTPASLHALAVLTGLSHLDMSGCADAVTDDSMRHLAGTRCLQQVTGTYLSFKLTLVHLFMILSILMWSNVIRTR